MNQQSLARGLAVFSLGLGLAELLAPRQLARLAGINDDHDNLIRLLGLRELTSGLGIMQGAPGPFLWSRVGGDVMDLALLGAAARSNNNDRARLNIAMAAVAGVTILDVLASVLTTRDWSEPGWRVQGSENYSAGFQRGDPKALRAASDEAMAAHQSGHAFGAEARREFDRLAPGGDVVDELAGNDDGLEQIEPGMPRPDNPVTGAIG